MAIANQVRVASGQPLVNFRSGAMTLKKAARAEIIAPMEIVIKAKPVALADCCGTKDPYQYIRYGTEWKQVVWLPAPTENDPKNMVVATWTAKSCHNCGKVLGENTRMRTYHAGANEPLDSMIQALGAQK